MATVVFTGAHVDVYAETEVGDINFELTGSLICRFEINGHSIATADRDLQNAGRFLICRWHVCALPFATIQNEGRSINGLCLPILGISLLPFRPFHGTERIFPAEPIPVVDMKGHWDKLTPESGIADESAQTCVGWWTTATTFGSK